MSASADVAATAAAVKRARQLVESVRIAVRDFQNGGDFSRLYFEDPLGRIELVRGGLPASAVEIIALDMDVPKEEVYELLGVTRATALRQARARKSLSTDATERAVFVAGLVKMVEDMIPEGTKEAEVFDASKWVARWLDTTQPALGGKTPKSFLDTVDGRGIVRRVLGAMESGAYA